MDLYQLRYFLEVARELNFTRASDNLHLSTPAVSRSVALLERSLKKKLFHRNKRHVSLTTEGEFLKTQAQKIFGEIERTEIELAGGAQAPQKLRLASREMITNYLLNEPLLEFRRRYPQTRFGIFELSPKQMAEALKKDQIDFGFHYSEIADPALETKKLGKVSSHIYVSRALLGRKNAPATFEQVCRLPFIAPRCFESGPADMSLDGFPDYKVDRNIVYEGEFMETHRRYVLDGLAAGVLPDFIVKQEFGKGMVFRLPGPKLGREIYFFKRRGRTLPQAVSIFLDMIERSLRRLA